MDSLFLIGGQDQKLERFLVKMGYTLIRPEAGKSLPEVIDHNLPDLVLIDSRADIDAVDLCQFLRAHEMTKQVPIVYLAKEREQIFELKRHGFGKIEYVTIPYAVGTVVGRIATQLRLRKLAGQDESSATLAEINARLRDLNERFMKQLQDAQSLQLSLIPKCLPQDERYDLAAVYQPLEEVGGDWYYASTLSKDKLSVQVADVTGHGLAAAFVCAMTKLALIAATRELPHELMQEMNRLMSTCLRSGTFVTAFAYLYDPGTGHLDYARAGHPPGLWLSRKSGEVIQLKSDGFPFGFFAMSEYSHGELSLEINDVLIVYTDGLPEAQDRNGISYGYERPSRLLASLGSDLTSAEMLSALLEDFDSFREGRVLKDDVTMILLKRLK